MSDSGTDTVSAYVWAIEKRIGKDVPYKFLYHYLGQYAVLFSYIDLFS